MKAAYPPLCTSLGRRYLDKEGKWGQKDSVVAVLGLIKQAAGGEQQTFPLFTSLMRHGSAEGLSPQQRGIIVAHAAAWVRLTLSLDLNF